MTWPMTPRPGELSDVVLYLILFFRSKTESDSVDELMQKIDNFLSAEHATPEQVKEVAQQCLDSEMTMDAEQIKTLADQINAATGM